MLGDPEYDPVPLTINNIIGTIGIVANIICIIVIRFSRKPQKLATNTFLTYLLAMDTVFLSFQIFRALFPDEVNVLGIRSFCIYTPSLYFACLSSYTLVFINIELIVAAYCKPQDHELLVRIVPFSLLCMFIGGVSCIPLLIQFVSFHTLFNINLRIIVVLVIEVIPCLIVITCTVVILVMFWNSRFGEDGYMLRRDIMTVVLKSLSFVTLVLPYNIASLTEGNFTEACRSTSIAVCPLFAMWLCNYGLTLGCCWIAWVANYHIPRWYKTCRGTWHASMVNDKAGVHKGKTHTKTALLEESIKHDEAVTVTVFVLN